MQINNGCVLRLRYFKQYCCEMHVFEWHVGNSLLYGLKCGILYKMQKTYLFSEFLYLILLMKSHFISEWKFSSRPNVSLKLCVNFIQWESSVRLLDPSIRKQGWHRLTCLIYGFPWNVDCLKKKNMCYMYIIVYILSTSFTFNSNFRFFDPVPSLVGAWIMSCIHVEWIQRKPSILATDKFSGRKLI